MRNCATFDVDNIVRQSEFAGDHDSDRGEGFIDLDPFNGTYIPAGTRQLPAACLTAGTGPSPNMSGSTAAMP